MWHYSNNVIFLIPFFLSSQDRSLDFHALCALYAVTGTNSHFPSYFGSFVFFTLDLF